MSTRRNGRKAKEESAVEDLAAEFVTALATELKDVNTSKENGIIATIFSQSYEGVKDASLKNEIKTNESKYYEKFMGILNTSSISKSSKSKGGNNSKILLGSGGIDLDKVGWSLNLLCTSDDIINIIAKALVEEYNSDANINTVESEEYINMILSKLAMIPPGCVHHEAIGCLTSYCIIQIMKQSTSFTNFNMKNILTFLNHDNIMNFFTTIGYLNYWYNKVSNSNPKTLDFIIEIIELIMLTLKSIVYKKSKLSDNCIIVTVTKNIDTVVMSILLLYAFITDIQKSNKATANICGKLLQLLSSYLTDITSGVNAPMFWETFILQSTTKADDRNLKQLLLLVELSMKKTDLSTISLFVKWFVNDKNAQNTLQLLLEQSITCDNADNTVTVEESSHDVMNDDPVEELEFEIDTSATIIETLDSQVKDNNIQHEEDEDNDLMVKEVNKERKVVKRTATKDIVSAAKNATKKKKTK